MYLCLQIFFPWVCIPFGTGDTCDWPGDVRTLLCLKLPSCSWRWQTPCITCSVPKVPLYQSPIHVSQLCSAFPNCLLSARALWAQLWRSTSPRKLTELSPIFIKSNYSHGLCVSCLSPEVPVCAHTIEPPNTHVQIHSCINYICIWHERHNSKCVKLTGRKLWDNLTFSGLCFSW